MNTINLNEVTEFVKIKDIKVGDLVLTSKGYKKVLHLFNNGVQQVENYSMQLDINCVNLCATKIHNVKKTLQDSGGIFHDFKFTTAGVETWKVK